MSLLNWVFTFAILQGFADPAAADVTAPPGEPPRLEVSLPNSEAPLIVDAYGDTRFTQRADVANSTARRSLVARMTSDKPAAIFIGGDLVYAGNSTDDYETYRTETAAWSQAGIPVFPALGNHELHGCAKDMSPCLENWWRAAAPTAVRPYRWYSVALGSKILVLLLDSDSSLKPRSEQRNWFERQLTDAGSRFEFVFIVMHYPPVRDPIFPRNRDEKEVASYLSVHAHSLPAQTIVIGSHIHNYERFHRAGVTYLVSGGGGAKPVPVFRLFGELSGLETPVNFHYVRFRLQNGVLQGTVVRFDPDRDAEAAWSEPDRFEVKATNGNPGNGN